MDAARLIALRHDLHAHPELAFAEQRIHRITIGQITFDETELRFFGQFGQASVFQGHIVIGIKVIIARDDVALGQ